MLILGSGLCGLSGEFSRLPFLGSGMSQLIVFRALQGLGSAALFTSAFAIIADLFLARERGRFMGLFSGVYALAGALGPLIGGFFADLHTIHLAGLAIAGWRWVFYLNLPIALVAMAIIVWRMPRLRHQSGRKIDVLGAIFFVATVVPLLLALTWGGTRYSWASAPIAALLMGSALATCLFVLIELRTAHPLLPMDLFRNRVFMIGNVAATIVGAAFLGLAMFMPLFPQAVQGLSATDSGIVTFPLLIGVLLSAAASRIIASRTGVYKSTIVAGLVGLAVATVWLSTIGPDTPQWALAIGLFLVGIAVGPSQSLYTLAVQNAVPPQQLGVATSASQFCKQIGALIGVAMFGALLVGNLQAQLLRTLPSDPQAAVYRTMDLSEAQTHAMQPALVEAELTAQADASKGCEASSSAASALGLEGQ